MKKCFLLMLLANVFYVHGQERNITTTIRHGQNSTYLYDDEYGYITVHKQGSRFTYATFAHRDGTAIPDLVYWGYIPMYEMSDEQMLQMKTVVDEEMMAEFLTGGNMFEEVKGQEILITVFFDSRKGVVKEVCYRFFSDSPLMDLPVDVFYNIENKMKESVRISPTREGKKMTFLHAVWMHKIGEFYDPSKDNSGDDPDDPGEAEETEEEEEEEPPVVEPPIRP